MVDQATNYIYIHFQKKFSAQETIEAKEEFERHSRDMGIIVQGYFVR